MLASHTDLVKGLPKYGHRANENMVILQLGCLWEECIIGPPLLIAFNIGLWQRRGHVRR